ncbi:transposase, partial [Streptomyces sp. NPDC085540]|uniref:transposase n=1 Tax=Streptomyces sp. NPDC085540 TaxID=3365730 RepID=UPI0037CE4D68
MTILVLARRKFGPDRHLGRHRLDGERRAHARCTWCRPTPKKAATCLCRSRAGDDTATVTARQLRELVERLITAGQWQVGDPDVLVIADAGYDAPRLAHLLR